MEQRQGYTIHRVPYILAHLESGDQRSHFTILLTMYAFRKFPRYPSSVLANTCSLADVNGQASCGSYGSKGLSMLEVSRAKCLASTSCLTLNFKMEERRLRQYGEGLYVIQLAHVLLQPSEKGKGLFERF